MFTFIKKVIKTGTATHAYPLEPMPVDKTSRQAGAYAAAVYRLRACVNACPSNALTVETDLRYMLRGNTVSDAPLIIGSLDPCYSCTDRMTVVDVRKKKSKVVPYKELERYSIERKNSPLK